MIEVTPQRLKEFDALNLVGVGGISVVFSAVHLAAFNPFNNDRPVALKFVWDVTQAQQEVRRLILLDSNRGVNKLYGYFEAPLAEVRALLSPLLDGHQALTSVQPEVGPDALVGVLVMQLSKGCHLMKTRALEGAAYKLGKDEWVIDYEGRPYLQSLAMPLSVAERIAIVRGLMKIIIEAHEQEPPQVHGDLHPGNVHFNPKTEEVVVLDWSGLDIYGASGWITPWHDRLILGEIQALPRQTDVYLIALWVDRLLGNEDRAFHRLANSVLTSETGEEQDIRSFFKAFEQQVEFLGRRAKKRRWPYLLGVGLLALLVWQLDIVERLQGSDGGAKAARQALEAEAVARKTKEELKHIIYGNSAALHEVSVKHDLSRPQAVYVSKADRFVVYGGLPFLEGDAINNEFEIQTISLSAMALKAPGKAALERAVFTAHPLLGGDSQPLGCLLIYDAPLIQIANALSRHLKEDISLLSASEPRVMGLVYGDDPGLLLERMFEIMPTPDVAMKKHMIYYDGQYLRYWDLAPGTAIEGNLSALLTQYLQERMGYELTKIPRKLADQTLRREVTTPSSCLGLFRHLVAAQGYSLEVDQNGTTLSFRKNY